MLDPGLGFGILRRSTSYIRVVVRQDDVCGDSWPRGLMLDPGLRQDDGIGDLGIAR